MKNLFILALVFILLSCSESHLENKKATIEEIREVEKAFNEMAQKTSLEEAFLFYAADSAVLNRRGQIIKGKKDIKEYFQNQTLENVSLTWEPNFIDASESGDMAYTYGPFAFSATDTTGQKIESKGYFHTVWKRQENGSWKYVYD